MKNYIFVYKFVGLKHESFPSFIINSNNNIIKNDIGFVHFAGLFAGGQTSQFGKWSNNSDSDLQYLINCIT